MRARLFDVGVETGNHILVTLFDDAAFHFHGVSEFAASVGEILLEQSEALWLFILGEGRGEAFNFSNGLQISVLQLVERILTAMGSELKPEVRNESSHEIRNQYLDAAKAREMLGWQPLFDLDQGLALTIDWYRNLLTHER